MKKMPVLLTAAAILGLIACKPGDPNIPEKVTAAFSQKFPDARSIKWSQENDHEWEFEFKLGKKEFSANFDNNGNWLETEYEISTAEIPAAVIDALNLTFSGYKIEEAEISETVKGTLYEFGLEKGKSEVEAAFTQNGELVRKSESTEQSDGSDED